MEENLELTAKTIDKQAVSKNLRLLLLAHTVMLVNTALVPLQLPLRITGWISDLVTLVTVWALFSLRDVQQRYKKASMFLGISLVGSVLQGLGMSAALTNLLSITSLIACYQEYMGHSELMQEQDPWLAGKWNTLFYLEIGVGLLGGLGSVLGVVIGVAAGGSEGLIITTVLVVIAAATVWLKYLYLKYLKRMLQFYQE